MFQLARGSSAWALFTVESISSPHLWVRVSSHLLSVTTNLNATIVLSLCPLYPDIAALQTHLTFPFARYPQHQSAGFH